MESSNSIMKPLKANDRKACIQILRQWNKGHEGFAGKQKFLKILHMQKINFQY